MAVYLDYNATTPLDPRVLDAMQPWLSSSFGNSASRDHRWGWDAAEAAENARRTIADVLGVTAVRVIFTSGATESLNTILRAYVGIGCPAGKRLITCATEHNAVLACCRYLEHASGVDLEILPVDAQGHVSRPRVEEALSRGRGALLALMAGNHETGTVHPVEQLAPLCRAAGALLACDMAQVVGKCSLQPIAAAVDCAALSAHKFYGPPGAGVLILPSHWTASADGPPLLAGGGQERGWRSGSLNVPGIVGMGAAMQIAAEHLDTESARLATLRDRFERQVLDAVAGAWVNGDSHDRICNTTNLGFPAVDARILIRDMGDVGISTQAACASGGAAPSHVLKALGLDDERAYSCVRVSVGRLTTADEVDYAARKCVASAHKLRRSKSSRT